MSRETIVRCLFGIPTASLYCAVMFLSQGCSDDASEVQGKSSNTRYEAAAREASPPPESMREQESLATIDSTSGDSSQDQLIEARRLIAMGNFDKALAIVQRQLIQAPTDPERIFLAAEIFAAQGNLDAAIQTVSAIPATHPQAGLASLGQAADWLKQSGDWTAAIEKYKQILKQLPDFPLAHSRLAELYNGIGLRANAAVHMRRCVELGETSQYQLCAMTAISEPFHDSESLEESLQRVPMINFAEARLAYQKGDGSEAERLANLADKGKPNAPEIAAFRGVVIAAKQSAEALSKWHAALPAGTSQHADYWLAVGQWMLLLDKSESAVRAFAECVLRDPTHREAYALLASSLVTIEKPDLAKPFERRANRLNRLYDLVQQVGPDGKDVDKIEEIADLLEWLGRDHEALTWRLFSSVYQGLAESKASEFSRQRTELSVPTNAERRAECLCGLELEAFPIPEASDFLFSNSSDETRSNASGDYEISLRSVGQELGFDFRYDNGKDNDEEGMFLHQTMGGGVAVIDFDLNGWCDFYFAQAGGQPDGPRDAVPGNCLLNNRFAEKFEDVAALAHCDDKGYGQGVSSADVNQDGFPDLLIGNIGTNRLLINNGDGTFRDATKESGLDQSSAWTTSLAAADVNGDHLPDIFCVNYVGGSNMLDEQCPDDSGARRACAPTRYDSTFDDLFINKGDLTFVADSTVRSAKGNGLGLVIGNLDDRPGNEVFVGNDMTANHYWQVDSSKAGQMSNNALIAGCAFGQRNVANACMGIAVSDFDHNGFTDLFVSNHYREGNNLFSQGRSHVFRDQAPKADLYDPSYLLVGFGAQAIDLDNDTWPDIALVNGHVDDFQHRDIPFKMRPQIFRNRQGTFELMPAGVSGEFGIEERLGRGLASCDFNRDGRVDFVATYLDGTAKLIENQSTTGNWISLRLVGTKSERNAVGAKVTAQVGDSQLHFSQLAGDGFLSSNQRLISIGLAAEKRVQVEIVWPSGIRQTLAADQGDTILTEPLAQ